VIDAAGPAMSPAELRLLQRLGATAVLASSVPDARGAWLVELHADADTLALDAVEPAVRLLAAEAVTPHRDASRERRLSVTGDPLESAV